MNCNMKTMLKVVVVAAIVVAVAYTALSTARPFIVAVAPFLLFLLCPLSMLLMMSSMNASSDEDRDKARKRDA